METYHRVVRRQKQDLRCDGFKAGELIENDRAKQYGLPVPPAKVERMAASIQLHSARNAGIMDALARLRPWSSVSTSPTNWLSWGSHCCLRT